MAARPRSAAAPTPAGIYVTGGSVQAGIYCRMSRARDGEILGILRQEDDSRELCRRRGWQAAHVYTDNDISAYSGKPRPAYQQMMADLASGQIGAIVAYNADRLHRSPKELEAFIDAVEAVHAGVATVSGGDYDLSTADGRMVARIIGAAARHQSERAAERIRRKQLELASRGLRSGGGHRPYGYERDGVTIKEDEAKVIREAANRVLAGEPIRSICRDFRARGIRPAMGDYWRPHVMKTMLTSGRISGQREYCGAIVAKASWPAIISPRETARIRALYPPGTPAPKGRALLSGLIRCKECGERMNAGRYNESMRAYRCPGCTTAIKAEPLEKIVVNAVLYRIGDELPVAHPNGHPDTEHAITGIQDAKQKLTDIGELHAKGKVSTSAWLAAVAPLERQIDQAEKELARGQGQTTLTTFSPKDRWPDLSVDQQRAVLGVVLERITIARHFGKRVFRPERIGLVWRV